jgi:hypothetical protein
MSYEIIKRIRIENGNVFVTSCSSNVYPKTPYEFESTYLSNLLKEGQEKLDLQILKFYEDGSWQGSYYNKWKRAVDKLKSTNEYSKFNWHNASYNEGCPITALRNTKEFDDFLLSGLKMKTEKYILTNGFHYIRKVTGKFLKNYYFTTDKNKAKIFNFMNDVNNITVRFKDYYFIKL